MKSTFGRLRQRLLTVERIIAGVAILFGSPLVNAQDEDFESDLDEEVMEEVVITGSRIKRLDFTSISPLVTIEREAFEFSGQPTVEDTLNQMPQLQPENGRTSNSPGDGTATLDLRGLGPGRTLVLLNGRRLSPAGVGSAVDVNNLPRALIQRVEIITGGASTVYGSDAIAGVINFITIQDYEGLSLETSYSVTAEGDSNIFDANVLYGHKLANGRGNITLYAGYYDRKPLLASERALTRMLYTDDWVSGVLQERGSPIIPAGVATRPLVDFGDGLVRTTWNPDGTPRAWDSVNDRFNFAPFNYLQTPLTRYSIAAFGNINVSENFEAYFEAAFTRNQSRTNGAPAPLRAEIMVNTDNPVLTPETRQLFEEQMLIEPGIAGMSFRRRMLELGPRIIDYDRDNTRIVAGLRGQLTDGWDLDAWMTYTKASATELFLNDGSISRFLQGMLVDPVTGQCFDPSGGCVPLDVFGEGRLSAEGVEFLRIPHIENQSDRKQTLASVVITGAPFDIWTGPVNMAFGAEWRQDKGSFEADDVLFTGDTMGFRGSSSVDGKESVYELYTEALLPIIDNETSGQSLELELGARFSHYKHAGSVWTWKAGLAWQPLDSLRFRFMYQHSVRAPNIAELFTEQLTETGTIFSISTRDPCTASNDPAGSENVDKCLIQGLPASQIGIFEAEESYPVNFVQGGNPVLEPEDSDAITVGFVITPAAVPDLTLAIDYFDIEVNNTIGTIDAMEICFDPLNTGNAFCESIQRDQTGNIAELFEPISNRGLRRVKGIDFQVQYLSLLPSSLALFDQDARISVNGVWTHMFSNENQENIVTEVIDCNGYFGWPCREDFSGGSFPENRMRTSIDYLSGPLNIYFVWRWIDGMLNAAPLGSANFGFPDPILAVPSVPAYNYFDLGLGYHITDAFMLRFGINNLFDKQAPQMADAAQDLNTDTGLYDIFGRTYFLSLTWDAL
jgi:iron complex outermembrane receptor protein